MKMRVSADRDVCIGAGLCVGTSETVFDQDDDGIVLVLVEAPAKAPTRTPPARRPRCVLRVALRVIE